MNGASEHPVTGLTSNWATFTWAIPAFSGGYLDIRIHPLPVGSSYTQAGGTVHARHWHIWSSPVKTVALQGDTSVTGTLTASGICSAVSFTSTSDARFKDAVEDISEADALTVLQAVKPKRYVRSDLGETTFSDFRRVGFLAQDIQSAIEGRNWNNILGTHPTTGALMLDYTKLVPVLWGAVRAVEARLSALESGV